MDAHQNANAMGHPSFRCPITNVNLTAPELKLFIENSTLYVRFKARDYIDQQKVKSENDKHMESEEYQSQQT